MTKLSEDQFNQIKSIANRLQALTGKESEAGQLVEELGRILLESDTEPTYSELTTEPPSPKTKTYGGAYVI